MQASSVSSPATQALLHFDIRNDGTENLIQLSEGQLVVWEGKEIVDKFPSTAAAVLDYNGDGWLDLILIQSNPMLYLQSPGSNYWLKIRPQGSVSNRFGTAMLIEGYGIEVSISGPVSLFKVMDVGGSESILHFGLGAATVVNISGESISSQVYWPSSFRRISYINVPANQELEVGEDDSCR